MDVGWRYTMLVNDTDTKFRVNYDDDPYTLISKKSVIIRWNAFDPRETLLPRLMFMAGGVQLAPIFSVHDLYECVQITVFRDVTNAYSCRLIERRGHELKLPGDLKNFKDLRYKSVLDTVTRLLRKMEELQKKVRIWQNQCKHLFKKYREGVERVLQTLGDVDLEAYYKMSRISALPDPLSVPSGMFICSNLICSMLEGEALLLSCGGNFYNKAALALSSPPPCVPTFSKFALAIREMDWTVDFLCCVREGRSIFDSWEWCEERCRLVHSNCFTNGLDAMEDESLGADVRRQNSDREALRTLLDLKLSRPPSTPSSKFLNAINLIIPRNNTDNQDKLEAIWRKRLQPSSCTPKSYSPLDAFVIGKPDTTFVELLPGGGFKNVQKCKWLGETVALSTMSFIPKSIAEEEAGLLARVQHPNVVELFGYAFEENIRDSKCYHVTEHMEWDLHDLITKQLTNPDGTISNRPPFDFLVAMDIALQIVEAMIHVQTCRVIHRDLKPKNILASRKFRNSFSGSSRVLVYYTIKVIDIGSSKIGDQCSNFGTRKQGTAIYMAPEVWESQERYSWPADVYSFGLTCYEIFTGRLPLKSGMTCTFANIQMAIRGGISFPSAHPRELEELIEKCWAQNPSDRPSFEDVRKALWRLKLFAWQSDYSWSP